MASRTLPATPTSFRSPAKYLLFGVIALMALYVLRHNEAFVINSADPQWAHYGVIKWYLLPHGLAGALALLLGPFQFSDRLRKQYAMVHRVAGRIYVVAVLIAAPMGAYLEYVEERLFGTPRSFTIATLVFASMWLACTLIAFFLIRAGRTQQHRQWMTRSLAYGLIFLEVRVITGLAGVDQDLHAIEITLWALIAIAPMAADLILQLQENRKTKIARA